MMEIASPSTDVAPRVKLREVSHAKANRRPVLILVETESELSAVRNVTTDRIQGAQILVKWRKAGAVMKMAVAGQFVSNTRVEMVW